LRDQRAEDRCQRVRLRSAGVTTVPRASWGVRFRFALQLHRRPRRAQASHWRMRTGDRQCLARGGDSAGPRAGRTVPMRPLPAPPDRCRGTDDRARCSCVRLYAAEKSDSAGKDSMRPSRLPEEDGDDVSGGEVGPVWREDDVAIGAGVCGKVAGAVPANALYAGADAV
jgi:hypothetical protein